MAERWTAAAARVSRGRAPAASVRVAVSVRDVASGAELAALDADRPLRPASNMKLVTSAAALVLLGGGMEFLTPIEAGGPVVGGELWGDLVVRAAGDPLSSPDGDPRVEPRLLEVARAIRAAGIGVVTGDLVLDEGSFAVPAPGPGWPDPSQHWAEYCALSGGFTVNGGVLVADVFPGAVGTRARVEVHPSPHGLASDYDVRTTGGARLDVRVGATVSTVTVRGELPHTKAEFRAEFSHPRPVLLFASVFRAQLAAAGVVVRGGTRLERGARGGPRIAELRSPVDGTLRPINAESRNGVADQLFLALGHTLAGAGTREAAFAATRRALAELGVSTAGFRQVDGSGLSRDDRVSARQITALLRGVLAGDEGAAALYLDSLAVAGERGTLADRLAGSPARGRVRGKTGWIAGVSALSGVADPLAGGRLVFSILVEYPPDVGGLNNACFKPMQDEMAKILVEGGS
ncbi:MAG: D-alanyl-D-alanine carboxypeptidase/D-alanyl-D-alanine-endopeptidase [Planctomycetota bacterium]